MSDAEAIFDEQEAGPFARAVLAFFDAGLCPLPFGGEDGKRPLLQWGKWSKRPPRAHFERFAQRPGFAAANIGIVTGFSGITIVDCDDEGLVGTALEIFGPTPIISATPSGGHHLWYLAHGERCRPLRADGFNIDIKGIGGVSVEPPSIRPNGRFAGVAYRFVSGSIRDVARLSPMLDAAAVRFDLRREAQQLAPTRPSPPSPRRIAVTGGRTIPQGRRNIDLFKEALRLAPKASNVEDLLLTLDIINEFDCHPQLAAEEVRRVAMNAWRMQVEGGNWSGRGGLSIAFEDIDAAMDADSFMLLIKLRRYHGVRGQPFAIVPRAMAASGRFAGMSANAIRAARERLVAAGHLIKVHHGGRGPRDPSRYRLGSGPACNAEPCLGRNAQPDTA